MITVTEDFLTLDEEIIKCDEIDTYDDCQTKSFRKQLLEKCHCLPVQMGHSDKV